MRRPLAWLVIAPFGAAGVLVGHAFAYRLTGTPPGEPHDYLAHAPQVLALLVLAAAGLASLIGRSPRACLWQFALAAPVAFVLQEHLERVVHTGHVPWLLTSPVLLVGLLLQAPIALLSAFVARRLLAAVLELVRARRPQRWLSLVLRCADQIRQASLLPGLRTPRAPPALGMS